jgi:hypothetical protein
VTAMMLTTVRIAAFHPTLHKRRIGSLFDVRRLRVSQVSPGAGPE